MARRTHTGHSAALAGSMIGDVVRPRHENGTMVKSVLCKIKHLIGKVASVDEDWIFKSKDWPYLWTK